MIILVAGCSSTGGKNGGFNDMPFDKMIVTENANYWKVPPGGGAMPDGAFHRGERIRIVGQAGGYLEVQNSSKKTFYVEPDTVGDLSKDPVQPHIYF